MKLHFGHLLGLGALAIAGCAAFFSVYGISQLFAGAFIAVVIMASALEFGKLAMASHLQRNWSKIGIFKKLYGVFSVIILVVITSAGIYGFLSNAYQKTADALSLNDAKVRNVTLKKDRYDEELASYLVEKTQLSTTANELSKGLANNVIQYKDQETGQIITTTSSNTRRALEAQLKDVKAQRDKISPKMDVLRDSVTSLELQILNLNITNEAGAELGPLKYMAKLLDVPMDDVINYFILLLVFVFDPLAIALVLATNWVFEQERIKREGKEEVKDKKIRDSFPDKSGTMALPKPIEDIEVIEPILIAPPIVEEVVEYVTEEISEEIFDTNYGTNDVKVYSRPAVINSDFISDDEDIYDEDAEGLPPLYDKVEVPEEYLNQKIEVLTERPLDVTEPPKPIEPEIKKVEPIRNRNTVISVKPANEVKSVNVKDLKKTTIRKFSLPIPRRGDNK